MSLAQTRESANLRLFRTMPISREQEKWTNRGEGIGRNVESFGQIRAKEDAAAATVCPEYSIMQTPLAFPDLPFSIFLFVCFLT